MNTNTYFGNVTDEQKQYADAHLYRQKYEDDETGIANAYLALEEKKAEIPEEKNANNLSATIMTIQGVEGNYWVLKDSSYLIGPWSASEYLKEFYQPTVTRIESGSYFEFYGLDVFAVDNVTEIGETAFYQLSTKKLSLLSMTKQQVIDGWTSWFYELPYNDTLVCTSDYPDGFIMTGTANS
jgi:hypothetical protein